MPFAFQVHKFIHTPVSGDQGGALPERVEVEPANIRTAARGRMRPVGFAVSIYGD